MPSTKKGFILFREYSIHPSVHEREEWRHRMLNRHSLRTKIPYIKPEKYARKFKRVKTICWFPAKYISNRSMFCWRKAHCHTDSHQGSCPDICVLMSLDTWRSAFSFSESFQDFAPRFLRFLSRPGIWMASFGDWRFAVLKSAALRVWGRFLNRAQTRISSGLKRSHTQTAGIFETQSRERQRAVVSRNSSRLLVFPCPSRVLKEENIVSDHSLPCAFSLCATLSFQMRLHSRPNHRNDHCRLGFSGHAYPLPRRSVWMFSLSKSWQIPRIRSAQRILSQCFLLFFLSVCKKTIESNTLALQDIPCTACILKETFRRKRIRKTRKPAPLFPYPLPILSHRSFPHLSSKTDDVQKERHMLWTKGSLFFVLPKRKSAILPACPQRETVLLVRLSKKFFSAKENSCHKGQDKYWKIILNHLLWIYGMQSKESRFFENCFQFTQIKPLFLFCFLYHLHYYCNFV